MRFSPTRAPRLCAFPHQHRHDFDVRPRQRKVLQLDKIDPSGVSCLFYSAPFPGGGSETLQTHSGDG